MSILTETRLLHKVFDPSLVPALVGTLRIALQSGAEALIALTVRNENTLANFLNAAGMLSGNHLVNDTYITLNQSNR